MSKEIVDPTISAHKNEVSTTLSIQEIFQLYQFEYIQSILRSLDCGLHMPVLLRVGVWAPSVLIAGDDDFVASVLPAVRFAKLQNPGNITVVTDAVTSKLWGALHNPSYHPVTVATSMSSVFGKQGIVIAQNGWSGFNTVQGVTRATHQLVVLGQYANRDPSKPERDDWDLTVNNADWFTGWSSTVNNGISVQSPNQEMAARLKGLPDLHPSEKNATGEFINGAADKYRRLQELERDLRKQGAMPGIH